jgi:DNA-binding MarR family transcriptional regulator
MKRVSSRFGLDWGQFLVLAALRGAGAPFRMLPRELNRLLLLSPAAITNRLYRLEAKGFIERSADPTDRRRLPVNLTARGLSAIDRAMSACVESEHELLTAVDADDVKVTIRTLRRLLAAYEQYPAYRRRSRQVAPDGDALAIASDDPPAQVPDPPAPPTVLPRREMWPTSHRDLERCSENWHAELTRSSPGSGRVREDPPSVACTSPCRRVDTVINPATSRGPRPS